MARPKRKQASVVEDSGCTLFDLVYGPDGELITQAAISAIEYTITDTSTNTAVSGHNAQSLVKTTVVFDTAQTDDPAFIKAVNDDEKLTPAMRTRVLAQGYNFKHELAASAAPTGGRVNNYDAKFTFSAGAPCYSRFALTVDPVSSS